MKKFTLDFDQFYSEQEEDVIEVTWMGVRLTVKKAVPASLPIMMARSELAEGENATAYIYRAADEMLGKENVDALCRKGATAKGLATLISRLFEMINGSDDEEEDIQEGSDDGTVAKAPKESKK